MQRMGEFNLIDTCFKNQGGSRNDFTRLGIGDDASIHQSGPGLELAISTDSSVEGVHWPEDLPLELAADRAVCAALSDLAAMGAEPLCAWLNVMAGDGDAVGKMGQGAARALCRHNVELVGGDTCRMPLNALAVTVAGQLPKGRAMRRDFANAADNIWLAGRAGLHASGLQQWISNQKDGCFIEFFKHISPQLEAGIRLRELGVKCCIDISDGLFQDAGHIARASGVQMNIELTDIPDWALLCDQRGEEAALHAIASGGEDYALLFTAPAGMQFAADLAVRIGACGSGGGVRLLRHGEAMAIQRKGFDHFA
jgi:thiamine-monophosphate kinase